MGNYVKIYEDYFNLKVPKKFDIHHLNLNHNDNSIENLLMLPHDIHIKYHELISRVSILEVEINIKSITESGNNSNNYLFEQISEFIPIYRECCIWKDYKQYLLNIIPNIHNIIL